MFDVKKYLLDLFFPIQCLSCGREGQWLCASCFDKIKIDFSSEINKDSLFNGILIVADYNQELLQEILRKYKYDFIIDLGQTLSRILNNFLEVRLRKSEIVNFDLVIPVPLARKRKIWRGFNQSEILAKNVSQKFLWPFSANILYRCYHTRPQVGLKAIDRKKNVRGIFKIKNNQLVKDKNVLLIDDVITTGTTMQECAKILKKAGAREIWGLVIAKG